MSLFKTIFWFGAALMLMPHEPNLGFARPVDFLAPARAVLWQRLAVVQQDIARAQAEAPAHRP